MSAANPKLVADLKRELAVELRANRTAATQETRLHAVIASALTRLGVRFVQEHRLGEGERLDFLVEDTVCIEVKKGAAGESALRQIGRYLEHPQITAAIGIAMRWDTIPPTFRGKPVHTIELWRLVL